jgi:hypothetical protein
MVELVQALEYVRIRTLGGHRAGRVMALGTSGGSESESGVMNIR